LAAKREGGAEHGIAYLDERRKTDKLNLIRDSKGRIKGCEHNAVQIFDDEKRFDPVYWDDFRHRMRFGDRDFCDHDTREAVCWIQSTHQVPSFTPGQVHNALSVLAYSRRRDSLQVYVRSLAKWDGTPRIEVAFGEAWGAPDTALTRAASRNFFIAAVARALNPGCQVDTVWIFEGPQGRLKSSALRKLGGEFHAEISAPIGSPDFVRELRGLWLAELSELDSLHGREASTVKRLLSATVDRMVEKYERHATAYPRRAVFVATTNEGSYWRDSTGARRLVPIKAGEILLEMIAANRAMVCGSA
jgi:predicted P-loop ATPase